MPTTPSNITGFQMGDPVSDVVHDTAAVGKAVITTAAGAASMNNLMAMATTQAITVAGAVDITSGLTTLNGVSGAYAVTLAAPAAGSQGQKKIIRYLAGSTNAITMALTNCQGGSATTSASFAAVDQTLVMESTGTKWMILGQSGVVLT